MKRTWIPYVAVAAAIVAGTVCSTAFADNKFKFNGGSFQGGQSGNRSVRNLQSGGNIGGTNFNKNLGSIQKFNQSARPPISGISSQHITGGLKNSGHKVTIGNSLPGNIHLNQGHINKGIHNKPISGIQHNLGGKLGISTGNITGNVHAKPHIGIGSSQPKIHIDGIKKLGGIHKGIDPHFNDKKVGIIDCKPICPPHDPHCKPKCDPHDKHCTPWWCLPHCDPWYKPCYKPCTTPIIVTVPVPVQTTVAVPVAVPVEGAPAPVEKLLQIPVGATLTLQAAELGDAAGQVLLVMDKVSLPAQIGEWTPAAVTATLPLFGLAAPTQAELVLMRADGQVASSMKVELIPAQPETTAAAAAPQQQVPVEGSALDLATAALAQ